MTLARSAWPIVLVAGGAAFAAHLLCGWFCSGPLLLLALLAWFVFRDPPREVPPAPLGIVSPVDGRVLQVEEVRDPYLDRDARKITLRMQWWGPYLIRSPSEGKVCQQWYLPQGLNAADLPKADAACIAGDSHPAQPRYAMRVRTDEGDEVVLVLRGGMISTRFVSLVRSGGRIGQGQRCGLLRFGGLVEVYVPVVSRVKVTTGATVQAGSDIIASLVHRAGAGSAEPKEVFESV